MSWGEVKKINSNLDTPLDDIIMFNLWRNARAYFYNNTTFEVPFNCNLVIRCIGAGGNGIVSMSASSGGGGGGYAVDKRKYKKGDIINITVAEDGNAQAVCSARGLSMIANRGENGKNSLNANGGTATGGNIKNITGGKGMNNAKGENSEGCAGGGGCQSYGSQNLSYDGGEGGFAGGNGGSCPMTNGSGYNASGGNGGFCGGHAGHGAYGGSYTRRPKNGGNGTWGIGGDGGYAKAVEQAGNGGNGYIFGGNGGFCPDNDSYCGYAGSGYKPGKAQTTNKEANSTSISFIGDLPNAGTIIGGGGGSGNVGNIDYSGNTCDKKGKNSVLGGVACCMISFYDDTALF